LTKVFVVIVSYNPIKWIDKTLQSIFNQALNVDVIVVDNGSTDGSLEFLENTYPNVNLIKTIENIGFGRANNLGIRQAYDRGADYVFLLNQDAWFKNNALVKLVEIAELNKGYGIISPIHLNGKGDALDTNFATFISPKHTEGLVSDIYMNTIKNGLYTTDYVNAAAWLLSRKCIETVGGFNPLFFMYAEDDNYLQRVKYHGLKVGIYPLAEIFHDREQRSTPKQLVDKVIIEKRNWILKYSNPNQEFILDKDIAILKKGIKLAMLKGKFALAKSYSIKRSKLIAIREDVHKHYQVSKQKGLSFL
jgi:GT2 family glycosyltransferase